MLHVTRCQSLGFGYLVALDLGRKWRHFGEDGRFLQGSAPDQGLRWRCLDLKSAGYLSMIFNRCGNCGIRGLLVAGLGYEQGRQSFVGQFSTSGSSHICITLYNPRPKYATLQAPNP
jgi:hypothetical protein